MAVLRKIKDGDTTIYPRTIAEAVFMDGGKTTVQDELAPISYYFTNCQLLNSEIRASIYNSSVTWHSSNFINTTWGAAIFNTDRTLSNYNSWNNFAIGSNLPLTIMVFLDNDNILKYDILKSTGSTAADNMQQLNDFNKYFFTAESTTQMTSNGSASPRWYFFGLDDNPDSDTERKESSIRECLQDIIGRINILMRNQ